ncbi:hypothetical protein [Bradyrhizobium sp. LMTR 3]|uniref:hypothetical protein n=1 Tax=Bradyrhizobium sp. LMTR 3 TaxID=189873 RepID=UPI00159F3448|nr:hypothetical protein [Bradyrhizobium sp. LMTR 3]
MDQSVVAKRAAAPPSSYNVAIVVNDFRASRRSRLTVGLTLRAFMPQGHKAG